MARHPRVSLLATIVALSGGFFTRSLVGGAMLTVPRGILHGSKVISRQIHLCKAEQGPSSFSNEPVSVTGIIYQPCLETHGPGPYPIVTLFTKQGCTLCDKVKDMLSSIRDQHPHTLEVCFICFTPFSKSCSLCLIYGDTIQAVDITDTDKTNWFDKYKYDIPVLHINRKYWTKHRLTLTDEVIQTFQSIRDGTFISPPGEPNALAMEHKIK